MLSIYANTGWLKSCFSVEIWGGGVLVRWEGTGMSMALGLNICFCLYPPIIYPFLYTSFCKTLRSCCPDLEPRSILFFSGRTADHLYKESHDQCQKFTFFISDLEKHLTHFVLNCSVCYSFKGLV